MFKNFLHPASFLHHQKVQITRTNIAQPSTQPFTQPLQRQICRAGCTTPGTNPGLYYTKVKKTVIIQTMQPIPPTSAAPSAPLGSTACENKAKL